MHVKFLVVSQTQRREKFFSSSNGIGYGCHARWADGKRSRSSARRKTQRSTLGRWKCELIDCKCTAVNLMVLQVNTSAVALGCTNKKYIQCIKRCSETPDEWCHWWLAYGHMDARPSGCEFKKRKKKVHMHPRMNVWIWPPTTYCCIIQSSLSNPALYNPAPSINRHNFQ